MLLIILGTIGLVAYGQGYMYDRESGEFTTGGLALIDSTPDEADLWVDGQQVDSTPERLRLAPGEYTFGLFLDGYRPWEKRVEVLAGEVLDVEYPLLIPNTVGTTPIANLRQPRLIHQSNDQRLVAVVEAAPQEQVRMFRSGGSGLTTIFTLPETSEAVITAIEWSTDGSRLLVTTEGANAERFLVLVEGEGTPLALNELLGAGATSFDFSTDSETLYALTAGDLVALDITSEQVTPVAKDVSAYYLQGDELYLVQTHSSGTRIIHLVEGESRTVHELDSNDSYTLDLTVYNDDKVLILHNRTREQVTLLSDVDSQVRTRTLPLRAAAQIYLNPSRRFLVMQNQAQFLTYDFNHGELYAFELETAPTAALSWYDDWHLLASLAGSAVLLEFDGKHQEQLALAEAFGVSGSRRERMVYSIGKNALTGRFMLQRSALE